MDLFTPMSAHDFDEWNPFRKIIVHDYPRRFASLKLAEGVEEVALSWRSDLITPIVLSDGPSLLWIGVDQHVIGITRQGSIMFSIGLNSLILDIKRFPTCIAILCDAEVITVNLNYSIRGICTLNDIPSMIELINENLVVTFADGETQTVP